MKGALVRSLLRLGLSYVDVYYYHRIPSLEGAIAFAESCKRLVDEGLVRHIGLSEINGVWLRQVHSVVPICFVQQEWSLLTRNLEDELVPVCAELVRYPVNVVFSLAIRYAGHWNCSLLSAGEDPAVRARGEAKRLAGDKPSLF